jgi:hypothetical protein
MFASDLTTFLQILNETRANCIISTMGETSGAPWQAQLSLSEGRVAFCQVRNSADGQILLTNSAAVRWLASLGNLSWEQMDAPPRPFKADPFHPHAVPQRLTVSEQGGWNLWSRKQRQVFGLVDGGRSIERIALLLRQPLNVVKDIVHDFQSSGVIAVDPVRSEVREGEGVS